MAKIGQKWPKIHQEWPTIITGFFRTSWISEGREGRCQAGQNSYFALTKGRSDLWLETQKMKTFKKLFLSKEALDQKSEKKGPEQ